MAKVVWIPYCMDCDKRLTTSEGNREECPECEAQEMMTVIM